VVEHRALLANDVPYFRTSPGFPQLPLREKERITPAGFRLGDQLVEVRKRADLAHNRLLLRSQRRTR